ncbi:MAG: hypothetical protein Q7T54_03940 [Candidatus Levybacteria bacterium]|nr:hypothetical protein [Candidatus Levybacteria bacterium]
MGSKYSILSFVSVIGVGFVLAVTIFLVNQPQDIRQQASSAVSPTPVVEEEAGCPTQNSDGRSNVCRAEAACPAGEIEKENGKSDCTQRLGKIARCCTMISPK